MMMELSKRDAITEAKITIDAYRLGQFVNAPENQEAICQRKNKLLDKAMTFDLASLDILTQSAVARLIHNLVKSHNDIVLHNDLRLCLAFGYMLGKEQEVST